MGKEVLQLRHESESKGNNKLKLELFGLEKIGGYTHSDTDLGVLFGPWGRSGSAQIHTDPHRSGF